MSESEKRHAKQSKKATETGAGPGRSASGPGGFEASEGWSSAGGTGCSEFWRSSGRWCVGSIDM